ARADIITPTDHTWATVPANPTATQFATALAADKSSIESKWPAAANRYWTGVWKNQKSDPDDYDPNTPSDFNPVPVLQSWLVSGNESSTTGDTYSPTELVAGLT